MIPLGNLISFQDYNGSVLAAGKLYVYNLGRNGLATVYGDVNGAVVLPNPITLDNLGMCDIWLSPVFDYTIIITDAYGQEMFSRNIYPQRPGSGETIGTQLYNGIDPIVVNNQTYTISANTSKLGVMEPLYFVKDDGEETIIGFSGEVIPEGTMNESAFGYQDGQITSYNGSAFSAGLNYSAGANIDITDHVISGKDWSNEINDASANAYNQSTAWTDSQGYLTGVDLSEYAKTDFVVSSIDAATSGKYDTSSFSAISGSFLTAVPEGYATEDWVTAQGYLTTETDWTDTITAASANAYEQATAAIPVPFDPTYISGQIDSKLDSATYATDSGNFATTGDINDLVTSIAEIYQPKLSFDYNEESAISAINGSALAGGGSITGDYVSGVNTVNVRPYEWDTGHRYEYTTIISGDVQVRTAEWIGDTALIVSSGLYSLSAIGNELGNKLNSDYVTDSTTIKNVNNHAEMGNSAYRPNDFDIISANYVDIQPNWSTISLESYAYGHEGWLYSAIITLATNSTGSLPENWTLQNFEDGSAILVRNYNIFERTHTDSISFNSYEGWNITNIDASAMTYSSMELAPIAFKDDITVPDTYLQNTDLGIVDNKVTAISGVVLSAGTELNFGYIEI